jgi:hypothetical protein
MLAKCTFGDGDLSRHGNGEAIVIWESLLRFVMKAEGGDGTMWHGFLEFCCDVEWI